LGAQQMLADAAAFTPRAFAPAHPSDRRDAAAHPRHDAHEQPGTGDEIEEIEEIQELDDGAVHAQGAAPAEGHLAGAGTEGAAGVAGAAGAGGAAQSGEQPGRSGGGKGKRRAEDKEEERRILEQARAIKRARKAAKAAKNEAKASLAATEQQRDGPRVDGSERMGRAETEGGESDDQGDAGSDAGDARGGVEGSVSRMERLEAESSGWRDLLLEKGEEWEEQEASLRAENEDLATQVQLLEEALLRSHRGVDPHDDPRTEGVPFVCVSSGRVSYDYPQQWLAVRATRRELAATQRALGRASARRTVGSR
jgi:hypothetical protein